MAQVYMTQMFMTQEYMTQVDMTQVDIQVSYLFASMETIAIRRTATKAAKRAILLVSVSGILKQ